MKKKLNPQRTEIPVGIVEEIVKTWCYTKKLTEDSYRDALEDLVGYLHHGNYVDGNALIRKWSHESAAFDKRMREQIRKEKENKFDDDLV